MTFGVEVLKISTRLLTKAPATTISVDKPNDAAFVTSAFAFALGWLIKTQSQLFSFSLSDKSSNLSDGTSKAVPMSSSWLSDNSPKTTPSSTNNVYHNKTGIRFNSGCFRRSCSLNFGMTALDANNGDNNTT